MFKKIAVFLSVLMLAACEPEPINLYFVEPDEENAGGEEGLTFVDMPLVLDVEAGGEEPSEQTKATVLADAELVSSGALVLVYHGGRLVSYEYFTREQIAGQGLSPLKVSAPLTTCNFYILGNLNVIRKSDGTRLNLMEAYGASFPVVESDLRAVSYRLDGGDLFPGSPLRREKMSEVAVYGIPYQKVIEDVDVASCVSTGLPGANQCVRLFSKVSLTIDHGALDGAGAHPGYFVNKKIIVRQVNCRLQPFSMESVKAQSSEDILATASATDPGAFADYDLDMTGYSGSRVTVNLYVPENMQGNLLSGNTSNLLKTPANVPAQYKDYVTYVEYQGSVSEQAGGYGADVTYQFCLGGDALNNFDLRRGCRYSVTLGFSVTNIFAQPAWKVGVSGWSDSRNFRLTADSAYSTALPDAQMVAVRANRPGTVYVYSSRSGLSANALENGSVVDPGYAPSSLADCAWTSDFMSGTNAPADVPSRQWLLDRGITPYWNRTAGDKAKLEFVVTDATKFGAHVGEEKVLTLTLLPGDGGKTVSLKVKLYPNISILWDQSISSGFYPGQKRTATISGYVGELQYKVTNGYCWKNQVATGETGLIGTSYTDSRKVGNGSLPIWCYYCAGDGTGYTFGFRPKDSFNDGGEVSFTIAASKAEVVLESAITPLEITGKEETVSWHLSPVGSSSVIARSSFDNTAFSHVYPMVYTWQGDSGRYDNPDGGYMYTAGTSYAATLTMTPAGYNNSNGYPVYYMYRKAIGSEYDTWAGDDARVKSSYFLNVPTLSVSRYGSGRFSQTTSADVKYKPFVKSGFSTSIGTLHDYTMNEYWNKMDEPYRSYSSSTAVSSNAYFNVTERSYLELYALVLDDGSLYGTDSHSESVIISQAYDGADIVATIYEDGSSNTHSAGPHSIHAKVTNKWSGETLDVDLLNGGSFDVFVHFVLGSRYECYDDDGYEITLIADWLCPDLYSRTSVYDYIEEVYYYLDASEQNAYYDGTRAAWIDMERSNSVSNVDNSSYSVNFLDTGGWQEYAEGRLNYDTDAYGHETTAAEFYHQACRLNSVKVGEGLQHMNQRFARYNRDTDKYVDDGNIKHAGASLDFKDASGYGYYVFHWLKDLCASTYGWINILEEM